MPTYTQNLGLRKIDTSTDLDLTVNVDTDFNANWDELDMKVPVKSTADTTYYVSVEGDDTNDGLSAGTPFKTITKAVSMIPQVCNHLYTINLADGTYSEDVTITGVVGGGTIDITGNITTPDSVVINSIMVKHCVPILGIYGIKGISTDKPCFYAVRCKHVIFSACKVTATSATSSGVMMDATDGRIVGCTLSNRKYGIQVGYCANVYCSNNTGEGNSYAMHAHEGGQIRFTGTIPGMGLLSISAGAINNVFPGATEQNITLYVSTTGNDTNDGLTSETALRNIQTAINRIPQMVNHQVKINVAAGTYSESIGINGFIGKGSILLVGGTSVSDNYVVNSVDVFNCVLDVTVRGLKAISTTHDGFSAYGSSAVTFDACRCNNATTSFSAVIYNKSKGTVSGCDLSNRQAGLFIQRHSIVFSTTNTGTGNATGLYAAEASTIGKFSTQPTGTTAESTGGGGVIR
ncbi:hypothetical protein ACHHV8_10105 [Paenibacillus sp. TAB 01]|uniref:hypothetical protein n=1 Tax=Paenibacillus sp. TAB 01 TaxID=3368988 RepID=UPI003751ACD7